jgi:hypothetical protein
MRIFPESIRGGVLDAVGLAQVESMGIPRDPQRRRDPAFQANGPDEVPNGIAMCSLHHNAGYDRFNPREPQVPRSSAVVFRSALALPT